MLLPLLPGPLLAPDGWGVEGVEMGVAAPPPAAPEDPAVVEADDDVDAMALRPKVRNLAQIPVECTCGFRRVSRVAAGAKH